MKICRLENRDGASDIAVLYEKGKEKGWVPIREAMTVLLRSQSSFDGELALMKPLIIKCSESALTFLQHYNESANELGKHIATLLDALEKTSVLADVMYTDSSPEFKPQMPYQPVGFKDFLLYGGHLKGASKGVLRASGGILAVPQTVCWMFARLLRSWGNPYRAYQSRPAYYQSNHLNIFANGTEAPWPCYCGYLDYELEVAVIIGKTIENASLEEAESAIAGYVLINDFSSRDSQLSEMIETALGLPKSKGFGTSMGTVIMTADEGKDKLFTGEGGKTAVRINGKEVATSCTNHRTLMHSVPNMVHYSALGEKLHAGELLGMGTNWRWRAWEYCAILSESGKLSRVVLKLEVLNPIFEHIFTANKVLNEE
ncbi:hypothetical protein CYMTET_42125 [Cymbomonas tetramitiformis]|uniref:Fumarylacetoacetase-like C-terminal domain-containing protein n=1 Tax=Cymbomonas tetramitiformis TaxID=36881 RepID=A0AAE0F1J6_9CHLO|nr:hypothetical protein CYMTET_42125 [Cymbomonas tetramitiformis]